MLGLQDGSVGKSTYCKLDKLSSVLRTHVVEGKLDLRKLSFDPTRVSWYIYVYKLAYMHTEMSKDH